MERHLLRLILGIAVMSIYLPVFSQVKLFDSGVSKFYDNGTRITYFEMADFPNSAEMRDYVEKIVLENPDINRAIIYNDGVTFMYEAKPSIEPDMVVDAVNDALTEYKAQVGDFPPNDPPSMEKPKSNVIVTPHKSSSNAGSQSVTVVVNRKVVAADWNSQQKAVEHQQKAIPVDNVQQSGAEEGGKASTVILGKTYPVENNENCKDK